MKRSIQIARLVEPEIFSNTEVIKKLILLDNKA